MLTRGKKNVGWKRVTGGETKGGDRNLTATPLAQRSKNAIRHSLTASIKES